MTQIRLPYYVTPAAVVALACALTALGQPAKPEFFSLKDVKPGMHGTGRTVFTGDKVEDFDVEILGVLENAGPKQSVILARLSGGPIEKTGVMQGMSGSPVYIDGKLLGAVALAFPFSKEPIAGIRPIEEMVRPEPASKMRSVSIRASLSDRSLTQNVPKSAAIDAGGQKLMDMMTPLNFSGFSQSTIDAFGPELQALGFRPQQAITGGKMKAGSGPQKPIEPGSMISVLLMSGDMNIGADGTVTYVDGNRLYAFGHRFLAVGSTELPFARSSVIALLPNLSSSFKISSTGDWLGTITSDGSTAIAGELGRKTATVPVSITVHGSGDPISYRMQMVNDSLLSPLLLQMSMYSALEATERTLGPASIGLRGAIEFEGRSEPVKINTMYGGDFNVPLQASLSTALPLSYALQNSTSPLKLKSVNLDIDSFTDKRQLQLEQVWTSKREVHPGESVDIYMQFAGTGGRDVTKKITYDIPVGASTGTLYFTVADGSTMNAYEYQQFSLTQSRSPEEVLDFLSKLRGSRSGYIRVWRAEGAYQVQGEDFSNVPPSLALILNRSQSSQAGATGRSSKLAELEFSAGEGMITGTRTVQVEIKE